jgi:hypothetical protein
VYGFPVSSRHSNTENRQVGSWVLGHPEHREEASETCWHIRFILSRREWIVGLIEDEQASLALQSCFGELLEEVVDYVTSGDKEAAGADGEGRAIAAEPHAVPENNRNDGLLYAVCFYRD